MSVCHPNCAKANQRKLEFEKKVQASKSIHREADQHYDKTIRKKLTYSSSYLSSDSNSKESIVLSHVILPDETSVTPAPSFTKKRHHNLLNEKTPKCTPQDVKKTTRSPKHHEKLAHTKTSSKNPSPDEPRNDKTYDRIQAGISLLVSDESNHSEHNTDTTTGTTKYFDGYILANDSCDDEQDNFKYSSPSIKVNNKKKILKSNKKHQDDDDTSSQDNSSHYPSCPSLYENESLTSTKKNNKRNIKNKKSLRENLFEQVKQKKEVDFVNHIGDWRCFDDLCFCSLKCTTNIFKDKFIKKIMTSAVFCCVGIRLCRELDSWYIPF